MESLGNGGISDYISDCNIFPSRPINNGERIGVSQSSTENKNIYTCIATSSNTQSNNNSNNSNKSVHKKPSNALNQGKQSTKGKSAQKFPLVAKSMSKPSSSTTQHHYEDSDDDSSVNTHDCKDDGLHLMKSRSSSFDDDENDMSKRKFSSKKGDVQNAREKNREHAKNTRMRKKNYIESLKESIKMLTDEREKNDQDRKNTLGKLADQVFLSFHI